MIIVAERSAFYQHTQPIDSPIFHLDYSNCMRDLEEQPSIWPDTCVQSDLDELELT
jgi:hypothetical protein